MYVCMCMYVCVCLCVCVCVLSDLTRLLLLRKSWYRLLKLLQLYHCKSGVLRVKSFEHKLAEECTKNPKAFYKYENSKNS